MISNNYVQTLLKQLFGLDGKNLISDQDLLNYYLKLSKTSNSSGILINEEILPFFQESNGLISKTSFLGGIPLTVQYLKEQLLKNQNSVNSYENIYKTDEKKFQAKINSLSGNEHLYNSKFSLKMMGIFEINFDILNVTKQYSFVINGKRFPINFVNLKEEILEFESYIFEMQGLKENTTMEIYLVTEKDQLVSACEINVSCILDQNIHKKVYFFMQNEEKVCSLLVKTLFIQNYKIFYQEKLKKKNKLFVKLSNEINEQIQNFTIKINSLEVPTSSIMFLKSLDLISIKKKINVKKPEKNKNLKKIEKNVVSLENSIYEEENQKAIFVGKHEEEEIEFASKANRLLSIDCLPEYNFLEESSFRKNSPQKIGDDLDFDLSSIQGDRESQITIFWLDTDKDSPGHNENHDFPLKKSTTDSRPPKPGYSKRSSKLVDTPTNLGRNNKMMPEIRINTVENMRNPLDMQKGFSAQSKDLKRVKNTLLRTQLSLGEKYDKEYLEDPKKSQIFSENELHDAKITQEVMEHEDKHGEQETDHRNDEESSPEKNEGVKNEMIRKKKKHIEDFEEVRYEEEISQKEDKKLTDQITKEKKSEKEENNMKTQEKIKENLSVKKEKPSNFFAFEEEKNKKLSNSNQKYIKDNRSNEETKIFSENKKENPEINEIKNENLHKPVDEQKKTPKIMENIMKKLENSNENNEKMEESIKKIEENSEKLDNMKVSSIVDKKKSPSKIDNTIKKPEKTIEIEDEEKKSKNFIEPIKTPRKININSAGLSESKRENASHKESIHETILKNEQNNQVFNKLGDSIEKNESFHQKIEEKLGSEKKNLKKTEISMKKSITLQEKSSSDKKNEKILIENDKYESLTESKRMKDDKLPPKSINKEEKSHYDNKNINKLEISIEQNHSIEEKTEEVNVKKSQTPNKNKEYTKIENSLKKSESLSNESGFDDKRKSPKKVEENQEFAKNKEKVTKNSDLKNGKKTKSFFESAPLSAKIDENEKKLGSTASSIKKDDKQNLTKTLSNMKNSIHLEENEESKNKNNIKKTIQNDKFNKNEEVKVEENSNENKDLKGMTEIKRNRTNMNSKTNLMVSKKKNEAEVCKSEPKSNLKIDSKEKMNALSDIKIATSETKMDKASTITHLQSTIKPQSEINKETNKQNNEKHDHAMIKPNITNESKNKTNPIEAQNKLQTKLKNEDPDEECKNPQHEQEMQVKNKIESPPKVQLQPKVQPQSKIPPLKNDQSESKIQLLTKAQPQSENEPKDQEQKIKTKIEPNPKFEAKAKVEPKYNVETKGKRETKPNVESKSKVELQPKVDPQPTGEPLFKVEPQLKVESKVEPKVEPKPKLEPKLKLEAKPKLATKPKVETKTEIEEEPTNKMELKNDIKCDSNPITKYDPKKTQKTIPESKSQATLEVKNDFYTDKKSKNEIKPDLNKKMKQNEPSKFQNKTMMDPENNNSKVQITSNVKQESNYMKVILETKEDLLKKDIKMMVQTESKVKPKAYLSLMKEVLPEYKAEPDKKTQHILEHKEKKSLTMATKQDQAKNEYFSNEIKSNSSLLNKKKPSSTKESFDISNEKSIEINRKSEKEKSLIKENNDKTPSPNSPQKGIDNPQKNIAIKDIIVTPTSSNIDKSYDNSQKNQNSSQKLFEKTNDTSKIIEKTADNSQKTQSINESLNSSKSQKKSNLKSMSYSDKILKARNFQQTRETARNLKETEEIDENHKNRIKFDFNQPITALKLKLSGQNRLSSPILSRKSNHSTPSVDQKINLGRPNSPTYKFSIPDDFKIINKKSLMFLGLAHLISPKNTLPIEKFE